MTRYTHRMLSSETAELRESPTGEYVRWEDAQAERKAVHEAAWTDAIKSNQKANEKLHARIAALEADLDAARRQRNCLLARIHRDGGHYVADHGLDKALEDADVKVATMNMQIDTAKAAGFLDDAGNVRKVLGTLPLTREAEARITALEADCRLLGAECKAWRAAEHLRLDEPHIEFMTKAIARAAVDADETARAWVKGARHEHPVDRPHR